MASLDLYGGKGGCAGMGTGRAPGDSLLRTPSAHLGSGPHVWPDPSQGRLDVAQGGETHLGRSPNGDNTACRGEEMTREKERAGAR